jgi:hypothetical protein
MEFKQFNEQIKTQFQKMCNTGKLFKSSISGSEVWKTYLENFKDEDNKIFRDPNSSEHNCNCCHNFIRRYGNIISINSEGKLESIFSNIGEVGEYTDSAKACNILLVSNPIQAVFFETYEELNKNLNYEKTTKTQELFQLGVAFNHKQYTKEEVDKFGIVNTEKVYVFDHFNVKLPKVFVDFSGKSIGAIEGLYRDKYSVFKRAMEEIPLDTLILVRDLINQGSLLDGAAHIHYINEYIQFHSYKPIVRTDNWYWTMSYSMSESLAKFKNHLIGVLCTELAEGKELNAAVLSWNKRVDPVNYHKAVAPITETQKKLAEKFVIENGYIESFNRRLATIDDIKASEILYKNSDNAKTKSVTIFDSVKTSGTGRHKRSEFDKVEEVSIEKFMSDILPTTTNVELLMENKFEGNLVNLTTITDKEAKNIFKWNNPFSYTFNGNLAGKSQIKEAVQSRGGKTDAKVRVSIHFPDTTDDYDLHCFEPVDGTHIYYSNRRVMQRSSGMLDLDAQGIDGKFPPEKRVENLTYSDLFKMPIGYYDIKVNNYSGRGLHTKFNIEVEIEGDITLLEFDKLSRTNNIESIGKLYYDGKAVTFTPENCKVIESKTISKQLWNLDSNEFHKVNLVCLTPNHWSNNNIGNKHYLFMLQGCKNPNQVRGFHNEHLISELLEHRKVLDVLGNSAMIESSENQLAGVGFNATIKDEVILRLSGSHKRIVKVKF